VEDPRLSCDHLRSLILLGCFANPKGRAFPSQGTLGEILGFGVRKVRRLFCELEEFGYVIYELAFSPGHRGGSRRSSNSYWLLNIAATWEARHASNPLGTPEHDESTTAVSAGTWPATSADREKAQVAP